MYGEKIMNLKKAKLLRKVLKKGGVDWREAKHVQREDRFGNLESKIFLDPKSGRGIYQKSKTMAQVKGF